jgi:hypothetical protein
MSLIGAPETLLEQGGQIGGLARFPGALLGGLDGRAEQALLNPWGIVAR